MARWTETFINKNMLEDEVEFLQLGMFPKIDFISTSIAKEFPTSFNIWPTREDPKLYKFNSFWIEVSDSKTIFER